MKLSENEKGSVTILICLITTVVFTSVVALIILTKSKVEKGIVEDSMRLAGRSVLSEYNPYIQKRYGLFLLNKDSKTIEKDIKFYLDENIKGEKIDRVNVNKSDLVCNNLNMFEDNVYDYMKLAILKKIRERDRSSDKRTEPRTLKNQNIIELLPSDNDESSSIDVSKIFDFFSDIDEIFSKTGKKLLLDEYIMSHFNNLRADDNETFFQNEVEYILAGSKSDETNRKRFRRKLILLRNLVNVYVIEHTPTLKATATAFSFLAGPYQKAGYWGIVEAWALAESVNEVRILEHGGKLPIIKKKEHWTMDVGSILTDIKDGYIDNDCTTGLDYQDYLRVFLFFTERDKKIKRLMDLIQINTQGKNDENFTFSNSSFGFEVNVYKDDVEYYVKEKY